VRNLYAVYSERGDIQPLLFVNSWEHPQPAFFEEDARRILRFCLRGPVFGDRALRSWAAFLVYLPWTLVRLVALLRRENVAVVNVHYPTLASVTFVLTKWVGWYRGRLVLSLHGTDLKHANNSTGLERRTWGWLLRHADDVVACSKGLAEDLASAFPGAAGNCTVIHNGVDAVSIRSKARAARQCYGEQRPRYILSIGNYLPVKRLDLLVYAYERMRQNVAAAPALRIVGRNGEEYQKLVALVAQLELERFVRLERDVPHERCMGLLSRCAFYVLSSRGEAFSISLLEAGALGRGVVATDVNGVRELLGTMPAGIIVPPEDERALADGMAQLARDPALAEDLGKRLATRVNSVFSWEAAGEAYLKMQRSEC